MLQLCFCLLVVSVPVHYAFLPVNRQLCHSQERVRQAAWTVKCSFLEIYNETLIDLLDPVDNKRLTIRESSRAGVYVDGLHSAKVASGRCHAVTEEVPSATWDVLLDSYKVAGRCSTTGVTCIVYCLVTPMRHASFAREMILLRHCSALCQHLNVMMCRNPLAPVVQKWTTTCSRGGYGVAGTGHSTAAQWTHWRKCEFQPLSLRVCVSRGAPQA